MSFEEDNERKARMISLMLVCAPLICSSLSASEPSVGAYRRPQETYFAPYEGPFPVSLDIRLDWYPWHHQACDWLAETHRSFLGSSFAFTGYVRFPNNFFYLMGTDIALESKRNWERYQRGRVDVNFQIGKYWADRGALRVGFMYDGFGVGGDLWLIHKDRLKWLTTLEAGIRPDFVYKEDCGWDKSSSSFIRWSNRLFPFINLYISFGVDHLHRSRGGSITQGFIGFGSSI